MQEGSETCRCGRGKLAAALALGLALAMAILQFLQRSREVPSKPGQSRLGLMPAGKHDHLGMQTQICQTIVKSGKSGLPFVMNQQTKGTFRSVALHFLPELQLQQTLENIEACRICPGADYGNLTRQCNLQISLPTPSIFATMGA